MSIESTLVANTTTTVYTSTDNTAITWLSFTNYSGSTVELTVNVVPNSGSASDANTVVHSLEIPANDTYQFYAGGEKVLLENGDYITAMCNTASSLSSTVSFAAI